MPLRILAYPLVIVLLGLLVRLPLLDAPGFLHDQVQFIDWGFAAREGGMAAAYHHRDTPRGPKRLSNYPPVQNYVCRALASIYPLIAGRPFDAEVLGAVTTRASTPSAVAAYVLFKWPAVIADLAVALLLYYALRRRCSINFAALVAMVYVLLPNVWHNSAVWGAVDALPVLFVLASMEMARSRRLTWMWVFAVLGMLTKPQACIFLPIWALISIRPALPTPRQVLVAGSAVLGLLLVVLLPFRDVLGGVWESYAGAPAFYPFTHLNGFSAWFLGKPLMAPQLGGNLLDFYTRDDTPLVAGLSARQLGVFGVLTVVGYVVVLLWRRRCDEAAVRWAVRVIPLAFFVLSTQMHERYLYPAVAVWAWTASPTARWWVCWVVLSACAAINVLWVWVGPFDGSFAASVQAALRQSWLGVAPGAWCALALMGVLIWTIVSPCRRGHPLNASPQSNAYDGQAAHRPGR